EDLLGALELAKSKFIDQFESIVWALWAPNNLDGIVERVNRINGQFHAELTALDLHFGWSKVSGVYRGKDQLDRAISTVRETLDLANERLDEAIASAPGEWAVSEPYLDVP